MTPGSGAARKKLDMSQETAKKATYADLCDLPDNVVGEIVDGDLVATPRPSYRHGNVAAGLVDEIRSPFQRGRGGPGGWWILVEPEIHLDEHVLVPDLAGWRQSKMPSLPEGNWTEMAPDWICEVLSPSTFRLDRVRKMPIYAEFQVPNIWLVDPVNKGLEVFRLESGKWVLLATYAGDDKLRAEPFKEIEIDLSHLWAD